MFKLNDSEIHFIALLLEGFFYGLYSGIFAMHIQYQTSKKDTDRTQNLIFYSICVLYVLSVGVFISDIAESLFQLPGPILHLAFFETTSFGCSDFIAQFILVYRCWIVWGCNTRIVIIPSILALAFLASWIAAGSSTYVSSGELFNPSWAFSMTLSALVLSLTVNALVTGLIVFRIFKVFRNVQATSDDKILGATGGNKLRRIIFILIESGMTLFSIQLARVVVTIVWTNAAMEAFNVIVATHQMLNGIIPTISVVRISMGLSFHDEKSMEEVAVGSLRFAFDHMNSVPETGIISIVDQDSRGIDDVDVQRSNNINIVERDEHT